MSQEQAIIAAFKIVLIADLVMIAVFVADYTRLTRGGCWRNEIGRTLTIKDMLLGAALTPSVLSLFFKFSRLTSHVAAWIDVALFGAIAVVMLWRVVVFERIHREKDAAGGDRMPGT